MAGCRICSGDLELKVQGNGAAVTAAALSPSAHARRRPRRPARLRRVRHRPAADPAAGRGAARPLPRHARRRVPERGGRPARDREPPARPDRRARARPGGCSTSAAATACCSTRPALAGTTPSGWSCAARARATRARRSASTSARCRSSRSRRAATATRRASSTRSCSPTCSSTSTIRSPRSTAAPRLLRPAGVLCVVTPDPSSLDGASSPARAGGATCPPTPCCCRGARCAS